MPGRKEPKALRLYRVAQGRSQFEIAEEAGISATQYSMLERGLVRASAEDRQRLAKILGVEADLLFADASTLLVQR